MKFLVMILRELKEVLKLKSRTDSIFLDDTLYCYTHFDTADDDDSLDDDLVACFV